MITTITELTGEEMAKNKISCDGCAQLKDRLIGWKGKQMCSTCVTLASAISNHPDTVDRMYTMIHSAELVVKEVDVVTPDIEVDYLREAVWAINQALGGGYVAGELPGAVKELVERLAGMTTAAEVEPVREAGCDPHNCEELRAATAVVLDIAGALGGVCETPEKPNALAGTVLSIVAERDGLRMDNTRLLAEIASLQMNCAAAAPEVLPDLDRYVVPDGYESLLNVFVNAMHQAANGKGMERHATPVPFECQSSCNIARDVGIAFPLGQVIKKAKECQRLVGNQALFEILGSMNYLAIAYIIRSEELG